MITTVLWGHCFSFATFFQGLVFKWGSLVGISLPSTSGPNGTTPFVAGDVVFRPKEFTGAITNDWTTVPWCKMDFAPYVNTTTDHLSHAHKPANIALGIGDICRYMGVVDGSAWRIPIAVEWIELYGSDQENKGQSVKLGNGWMEGNYDPLSGYAFGAGRNNVLIIGIDSDTRVVNADPNTNGTVFLSASGHKGTDGTLWSIGSWAHYMSSTASDAYNGYFMRGNALNVWAQQPLDRTFAFSVRCIRE